MHISIVKNRCWINRSRGLSTLLLQQTCDHRVLRFRQLRFRSRSRSIPEVGRSQRRRSCSPIVWIQGEQNVQKGDQIVARCCEDLGEGNGWTRFIRDVVLCPTNIRPFVVLSGTCYLYKNTKIVTGLYSLSNTVTVLISLHRSHNHVLWRVNS